MSQPSYQNDQKNDWRVWQWDRIVDGINVPVGDALVLYLPGEQDLDRTEALKRGFRSENLIGVDRSADVVQLHRGKGVFQGELSDVLSAWGDPTFDVICADLCCGLGSESDELIKLVASSKSISGNAVISVNLQRGRDDISMVKLTQKNYGDQRGPIQLGFGKGVIFPRNSAQKYYSDVARAAKLPSILDKRGIRMTWNGESRRLSTKHRGVALFFVYVVISNLIRNLHLHFACEAAGSRVLRKKKKKKKIIQMGALLLDQVGEFDEFFCCANGLDCCCRADIATYRSNRVLMDSVIFNRCTWVASDAPVKVTPRLAAIKAHRTMRMRRAS